jgi:hypothetical protein
MSTSVKIFIVILIVLTIALVGGAIGASYLLGESGDDITVIDPGTEDECLPAGECRYYSCSEKIVYLDNCETEKETGFCCEGYDSPGDICEKKDLCENGGSAVCENIGKTTEMCEQCLTGMSSTVKTIQGENGCDFEIGPCKPNAECGEIPDDQLNNPVSCADEIEIGATIRQCCQGVDEGKSKLIRKEESCTFSVVEECSPDDLCKETITPTPSSTSVISSTPSPTSAQSPTPSVSVSPGPSDSVIVSPGSTIEIPTVTNSQQPSPGATVPLITPSAGTVSTTVTVSPSTSVSQTPTAVVSLIPSSTISGIPSGSTPAIPSTSVSTAPTSMPVSTTPSQSVPTTEITSSLPIPSGSPTYTIPPLRPIGEKLPGTAATSLHTIIGYILGVLIIALGIQIYRNDHITELLEQRFMLIKTRLFGIKESAFRKRSNVRFEKKYKKH